MNPAPGGSVLLTGASGTLGRVLAAGLGGENRRLVLSDLAPFPDAMPAGASFVAADLTDPASLEAACPPDVGAIVHFGGLNGERSVEAIHAVNVMGTVNIFELARRRGARVVFASSNHAIGFYPRTQPLTMADPVRPDTYYGLSKVYAEALGRLYYDKHGIESVHLRIGSCVPRPLNDRHLATWLSYPDLVRLVQAALICADPGFALVWGISRNARAWWSGDDAARIGYDPQDEAETFAAEVTRETGEAVDLYFQGSFLCTLGYDRRRPLT